MEAVFFDDVEAQTRFSPDTVNLSRLKGMAHWWDHAKRALIRGLDTATRLPSNNAECQDSDGTQAGCLREEIRGCQDKWREAKARRLRRKHALFPQKSTADFYKRIAYKYGDNVVYNLDNARHHASPTEQADAMAFGWSSIMQQQHAESQLVDGYIASIRPLRNIADLEELDAQVSLDEVRAAIKRCKRGKSCGPDGLGNTWYQDHCDRIAPILVKLINDWLQAGVVPARRIFSALRNRKQRLTR
ncbi:REVERSE TRANSCRIPTASES [Plasmopara halstedii]|uniref:REVERSE TRANSCRIPTASES n=1 Tax=Plasmopara halstedii TaxID=4781 RepID=A0A0P1AT80_PLAHL|nr:REVERSE TRANSCRIPTASES [Plasmopara halstedii]CEG43942.1 REVERSE TRANSCRIPTASES [Plasmopara halstedii]|eukprot:XP_024580311.1 REVERSE TRANSCRIPTASES [Plasmopara halstedii]